MLNPISTVTLIKLPHHFEDNGDLVGMARVTQVPFPIARVFVVWAPAGAIRGQHAQKACTPFLTCFADSAEVLCDDGLETATSKAHTILERNGIVAIALPNLGSIFRIVMQEMEPYICPPAHLIFFNPYSLSKL